MKLFKQSNQLNSNLVNCFERELSGVDHLVELEGLAEAFHDYVGLVIIYPTRQQLRKVIKLFILQ